MTASELYVYKLGHCLMIMHPISLLHSSEGGERVGTGTLR
uniref:Uncharacterized protein n=1 Tax=Rhizophora mucronata TaxID=61149 RepID=A0A2P2JXN3_RHIMU